MIEAPFAPLATALTRSRSRSRQADALAIGATLPDPLIEDIRLFAATWVAGFVFFLAFLG